MRCVEINDFGVVIGAFLWDEDELPEAPEGSSYREHDEAQPGWVLKDGVLSAPPPLPESVPEIISDRQFAQALARQGVITKDEALAFVKRGEVPKTLQAVVNAISDPDERFDVDMAVSGATTFERSNPSTLVLAGALQWTPEQMDDLWRSAAAIP